MMRVRFSCCVVALMVGLTLPGCSTSSGLSRLSAESFLPDFDFSRVPRQSEPPLE